MKKIILTKGLPGSGKSTWAKELLAKEPGKWKRINKDEMRAMFDNGKWSKQNEKFIILQRNIFCSTALAEGYNVIIDDTNLAPKHEEFFRQYAKGVAEVEIKDFTDVPLEECIRRDQKRSNYVGEKVIKQMYNQFLRPQPKTITWNPDLPNAVICDLDGTLCLFGNRNPYDRDFRKDEVNDPVLGILQRYQDQNIIFFSGRNGKYRKDTEWWLKQTGISYAMLVMREEGDNRKDNIVKEEMYRAHVEGKYNVYFVLDDRDQVVELWRGLGLTCLQVADGDF